MTRQRHVPIRNNTRKVKKIKCPECERMVKLSLTTVKENEDGEEVRLCIYCAGFDFYKDDVPLDFYRWPSSKGKRRS